MFSTFSAPPSQLFFFISWKLSSIRNMIFFFTHPLSKASLCGCPLNMWDFDVSWFFFLLVLYFCRLVGEWGLNRETFYVTFYAASKISLAFTNSLLNLTEYCLALLKFCIYLTLYFTIYYNIIFLPLPNAALITTALCCVMFFLNTSLLLSYWWLSLCLSLSQGLVFSSCPVQKESRSASCLTASCGASPPAGPLTACDLLCQVNTHISFSKRCIQNMTVYINMFNVRRIVSIV